MNYRYHGDNHNEATFRYVVDGTIMYSFRTGALNGHAWWPESMAPLREISPAEFEERWNVATDEAPTDSEAASKAESQPEPELHSAGT